MSEERNTETLQPLVRAFEATVDDVRPNERAIIAKIHTGDIDRYRTVISTNGIDLTAYRQNPVVLHEHGKDPARGTIPVGRNQWIKTDPGGFQGRGCMIAKTIFRDDEYSNTLYEAYASGDMRGWSIRGLPRAAGPPSREEMRSWPELAQGCQMVYRDTELLEYSTTCIPGNAACLSMLVSRGIWIPDEAQPLLDEYNRTMTSLTGQSGGFLEKPDHASEPPQMDEARKRKRATVSMAVAEAKPSVPKGSTSAKGPGEPGLIDGPGDGARGGEPAGECVPSDGPTHIEDPLDEPGLRSQESETFASPITTPAVEGDLPDAHGGSAMTEPEEKDDPDKFSPNPPNTSKVNEIEPEDESNAGERPGQKQGLAPSMSPDTRCMTRRIEKQGDSYVVLSEKGKRLGGPYKSKGQAKHRLQQVEYFKHQGRTMVGAVKPPMLRSGPEPELEPGSNPEPKPMPKLVRSTPYIDSDGGYWHIRDIDGNSLMRFDDSAMAEAMLATKDAEPIRFEDVHAAAMDRLDEQLRGLEDRFIARVDLYIFGRV